MAQTAKPSDQTNQIIKILDFLNSLTIFDPFYRFNIFVICDCSIYLNFNSFNIFDGFRNCLQF